MANQNVVSSLIGANLSATGDTALFALGTVVSTDDGGRFEYVEATATLVTGEFVLINTAGTAKIVTSGQMTANASGYDFGAAQGPINQGEFGWVAKQGRNLFVLCSGTLTAGGQTDIGFGANSGRLVIGPNANVGMTMLGVFITSSTPTDSGEVVTLATFTWPRIIAHR